MLSTKKILNKSKKSNIKIKYLNNVRKINNYHYLIEVDGGINLQTAKLVKEAGCDIIVVGSYLMKSKDIDKTYHQLYAYYYYCFA